MPTSINIIWLLNIIKNYGRQERNTKDYLHLENIMDVKRNKEYFKLYLKEEMCDYVPRHLILMK